MRIVQQALYLEVADRLRAMIDAHTLVPGAWIDESAMAETLGISRTPLREALKVLAAEGLVRLEPRRGCFVNELSEQDLDEIFPLMALLEGRCAYEAARNATRADLDALDSLHADLARYAQAGDIDAYYETNFQIHESIQRLAGNRWLSGLISDLRKVLRLSRHKSLKLPGRIQESCAEHLSVFAALKARDPEGAEAMMKTHLLRQRAALKTLDAGATAGAAEAQAVRAPPVLRVAGAEE
ncbi:GntR family transcriptional regulator [Cupriavidus necator]|uniref:GntR family transcriptional regulator n=1 Tax=Cupriavidus necator TaxID=106590 RepID=A0A367PHJ1_CUPNE|nr:GntR family transcriptional regulator [Cupriavidus necator]QQX83711.1 GntR family transcriptional regulator [Cupriavidus necator]RCJ07332.1 GntR family transcriptional regulator [Cupriavidus necator]